MAEPRDFCGLMGVSLIGILSDAHGNIEAFDDAIRILRELGAREFVFLGDAVGYIPCVDVVRRLKTLDDRVRCVLGNHEALLLSGEVDEARDPIYQLTRARALLSDAEFDFIARWPRSLDLRLGRFQIRLLHGSPTDPTYGYVYPDTDLTPFGKPADFLFMGNSHHPFVRRSNDCCFVNVGSCGLPRDHGSYGAAATFDDQSGAVEIYRFDIGAANSRLMHNIQGLHPSVIGVMSRSKQEFYGTQV